MTRFTIFTASFITLIAVSGNDKSVKSKRKPADQPKAEISAQQKTVEITNKLTEEPAAMVSTNAGDTVYYRPIVSKRKIKLP